MAEQDMQPGQCDNACQQNAVPTLRLTSMRACCSSSSCHPSRLSFWVPLCSVMLLPRAAAALTTVLALAECWLLAVYWRESAHDLTLLAAHPSLA